MAVEEPKRFRILAVDDEEIILNTYRHVIQGRDYATRTPEKPESSHTDERLETARMPEFDLVLCHQGDEAVEMVGQARESANPFAVVFLDLRMPPGPDGIVTGEKIREIDPDIQIVIVSGFSDFSLDEVAIRIPPVSKLFYLNKPFHIQEIQQFVSSLSAKWFVEIAMSRLNAELEQRVEEQTRALKESEARYRLLADNATDVIWTMTLDMRFTYVSPSILQQRGFTPEEALRQSIEEVLTPDSLGAVMEVFAGETERLRSRQAQPDRVVNLEMKQRCKDGSVIWTESAMKFLVDSEGQPKGVMGSTRDITERKRAEKALIEAKEDAMAMSVNLEHAMERVKIMADGAEKASAAKSEFLANMSHEIRSPMNAILGMTQITLEGELDEEQRDNLTIIEKAAKELITIINSTLDFSKIEAGKLDLESTDFELSSVVNGAVDMLRVQAAEKGLALTMRIDHEPPLFVRGDPGRLRQILLNLAGNAIKFTGDGEVSVQVLVERESEEDLLIRFEVRDTGVGIPEAKTLHIFDPFTQADTSTTREYGGTGLGLAISKQLVEMMGGTIGVQSVDGEGSTFRFTVPFEKQDRPACSEVKERGVGAVEDGSDTGEIERGKKSRLEGVHVLVAEDRAFNQMVVTRFLEKKGAQVSIAANGQEAINACESTSFDVILMDIQMPVVDGYQATAAIREMESARGARTPIIALTAHAVKGYRQQCLDADMDGYLTKPIEPEKLFAAVAIWTGREKEHRPEETARPSLAADAVPPTGTGYDIKPVLERFSDELDFFRELAEMFIEDVPLDLGKLQRAVDEKNVEGLREIAHGLKGTASNFGLQDLADLFYRLEKQGKEGSLEESADTIEDARDMFARIEETLKQHLTRDEP